MNTFSIRDIENLTGIKAHTLRIWEKRYGIVIPPTAPGKHRVYDNNDLKHILRISSLYHQGIKISRIAEMSIDEIKKNTLPNEGKSNFEAFISNLIEFALDGNESSFKRLLSELREMMGEVNMYMHVVFPFLNRIGDFWLNEKIAPFQEHFSSNIIRNELINSIDKTYDGKPRRDPKIVLFCPKGEHHEIPLLFCQFLLRSKKINTLYLGADVDEDSVHQIVKKTNPAYLLTFLITNFTNWEPSPYVVNLSEQFNRQTILICGPGFKEIINDQKNVKHMQSMKELIDFCQSL
ncbi:MAG: MerR family transcriptional regulator [Chitinophagia bacterium]|jgi:DNA-binding transcriptional MerR regulator